MRFAVEVKQNSKRDPICDKIAVALECARLQKGLSRAYVAERTHISERFLCAIEKGKKRPSIRTCWNLIRSMGVSADEIFYPETTVKDSSIGEITRLAATCTPKQREYIIESIHLMLKYSDSALSENPDESCNTADKKGPALV